MRILATLFFAVMLIAPSFAAAGLPDRATFAVAIERGDVAQAREWLDAGLPPDFEGSVIGTGLMIGAWEGNIPMMELFLARGADVNKVNAIGETALLHAAWKGHLDALRWLLRHNAQPNRQGKEWTALHYAAFAGHEAIAYDLLTQGADINAPSPNGSTPLMMAAREGRAEIAAQLLAAGAERDITNDNGENAVHWAMRNNNLKIARAIAGTDDFAELAARPAASWGRAIRSQPVPERVDALFAQARGMEAAGRRDAALKLYRAALAAIRESEVSSAAQPARPVTGLVISARRGDSARQKAGLQYATPAAGANANVAADAEAADEFLRRARELEAAGRRAEALAMYRQAAAVLRRDPPSGP